MGRARLMKKPSNPKERNLIKGALRRVFSRSDLRRSILEKALVKEYGDPNRKRVTRWAKCAECGKVEAAYQMQVDHIEPLIRPGEVLEGLEWDEVVNRLWCDESNLRAVCVPCHKVKSATENKERRRLKKEGNKK